jgi:hypothetical protein
MRSLRPPWTVQPRKLDPWNIPGFQPIWTALGRYANSGLDKVQITPRQLLEQMAKICMEAAEGQMSLRPQVFVERWLIRTNEPRCHCSRATRGRAEQNGQSFGGCGFIWLGAGVEGFGDVGCFGGLRSNRARTVGAGTGRRSHDGRLWVPRRLRG